jgi:serine/threonine protein phosphatase PrpC
MEPHTPRDQTMVRMLLDAFRKRMQMQGNPDLEQEPIWTPVSQESTGRKLSAPSRWLCAITDVGRRRSRNEDDYFLSPDHNFWIVADGMGGHAAGDVASAMTIQAIADSMNVPGLRQPMAEAWSDRDRLIEAFAGANERVTGRSQIDKSCEGMGSTAIAGIVNGAALHLCHVGDTRGYHLSEGQFRRLTNDHSVIWDLVVLGMLTSDEARFHPHRARITQAIGMPAGLKPELTSLVLKPADRILLCSDGLWEALADEEMGQIVASSGSMLELASMLVDRANMSSGQDNITAVLYEHGNR